MSHKKITIGSNQYYRSHFHESLMLYELVWLSETSNMAEDDYKVIMLKEQNEITDNYSTVNFLLLDNRDFLMTMTPELQEWSATEITSEVVAKYPQMKIALVVSQDIFSRVSVSQAVEEDETMDRVTYYFETREEAYEWILSYHKKHYL